MAVGAVRLCRKVPAAIGAQAARQKKPGAGWVGAWQQKQRAGREGGHGMVRVGARGGAWACVAHMVRTML